MAEWGSFHLTKQGESLLADAHNQKQLMLTRIVLGSGELAEGQSAGTLTELVKQEQSFPIRSITNNNDGTFTIEARVTNNSLTAGYRVKECGVMAETYSYDDEGNTITTSVLFGTAQATESDFMPAPTGATMVDASLPTRGKSTMTPTRLSSIRTRKTRNGMRKRKRSSRKSRLRSTSCLSVRFSRSVVR